jgi:hypothetical protein
MVSAELSQVLATLANICSMMPPFEPTGLLPPTTNGVPYVCTVDEVRKRFVEEVGAPPWRVYLFDRWELLRRSIGLVVPSARWWLWGCFISAHRTPQFGDYETIQAILLVPAADLPTADDQVALLVNSIRSAQEYHRVDLSIVVEFPPGDPRNIETMDALETKWRPRAVLNVADHASGEHVPAGFVEVQP